MTNDVIYDGQLSSHAYGRKCNLSRKYLGNYDVLYIK